MKVNVITTGGTIDKIYYDAKDDYQVGDPVIGDLLERMQVAFDYEVHPILRKDSLDLSDDDRQLIVDTVLQADSDTILVTHGTDGMVQTGQWLKNAVSGKCIVMTGALQPAAFRETDACLLYTSPSPRDRTRSRMPSSA